MMAAWRHGRERRKRIKLPQRHDEARRRQSVQGLHGRNEQNRDGGRRRCAPHRSAFARKGCFRRQQREPDDERRQHAARQRCHIAHERCEIGERKRLEQRQRDRRKRQQRKESGRQKACYRHPFGEIGLSDQHCEAKRQAGADPCLRCLDGCEPATVSALLLNARHRNRFNFFHEPAAHGVIAIRRAHPVTPELNET